MDEEISFIENDIFSLNLNLNKNNNCTPECRRSRFVEYVV